MLQSFLLYLRHFLYNYYFTNLAKRSEKNKSPAVLFSACVQSSRRLYGILLLVNKYDAPAIESVNISTAITGMYSFISVDEMGDNAL